MNEVLTKVCSWCNCEKHISYFTRRKDSPDGFYFVCKTCKKGKAPEQVKVPLEQKCTKQQSSMKKLQRGRDKEGYLLMKARGRAKDKGETITIDKSDIVIPETCPVFGCKLNRYETKTRYVPSLDRIDSTKGYVKGNIQVLSFKANTMKSDATPEELLLFAKWIFKTYGEGTNDKNNSNH